METKMIVEICGAHNEECIQDVGIKWIQDDREKLWIAYVTSFCKCYAESGVGEIAERQTLLRATKDMKWWRAMIVTSRSDTSHRRNLYSN